MIVDGALYFAAHHGNGRFEHGDVDGLTHAGAAALKQRGDDAQCRRVAGGVIDHGRAGFQRPGFRRAGDAHHAAGGLYHAVDGRIALLGAGLAVTGDGTENDTGVDLLQIVVTDTVARHGTALQVFDDHVGGFGESAKYGLASRRVDTQRYRARV